MTAFAPRLVIVAGLLAATSVAFARPVPPSPESEWEARVDMISLQLSAEVSQRLEQQLESRLATRANPLAERWSDEADAISASRTLINGGHSRSVFLSR